MRIDAVKYICIKTNTITYKYGIQHFQKTFIINEIFYYVDGYIWDSNKKFIMKKNNGISLLDFTPYSKYISNLIEDILC